jgi:hypothetical protein
MIRSLKIFFVVLLSMLAVTGWASLQCALWDTPRAVATHPWFIATLADAYWGFLTFYAWVFYKESSWTRRISWLVAILLLGNIAMSAYVLNKLLRLPEGATTGDLLAARA